MVTDSLSYVLTHTLTTTNTNRFIFQFGAPLDGPSWTVVTLIFYWILFPFVLRYPYSLTLTHPLTHSLTHSLTHALTHSLTLVFRHYDKKSDEEILRCIIRHFWFQLFLVTVVFVILLILVGDVAFYAVTFWPPARFPVFIMGVCAGLLCLRHKGSPLKLSLTCA